MRANSPYNFHRSPSHRSFSFSSYFGASADLTLPHADIAFTYYDDRPRSVSPFSRRVSSPRTPSEDGLTPVIERTLDSSGGDEERKALLGAEDALTDVYSRRWYLLLVFSGLALLWTLSWAAWGPISESAEEVFGWGDSQITMCVFLGNLTFLLGCIPFSWLMDNKGLRVCMVVSCFFVMAGAGLRCLVQFLPDSLHIWCIYGGQLLNGVAGPVAQGGGALLSNLWFPNNQRATSTAISTLIGYCGSALGFILGPLLVPSPSANSNSTLPDGNNTYKAVEPRTAEDTGNSSVTPDKTVMMNAILRYMDYQALAAVVLFVLVVVYFPDKPPRPPSLSAATEREDFLPGLTKLIRNKQFWLISSAFCLSLGVFEVWDVVLDVNLSKIGISQETAGWLGFYCIMAGCITGLLICRLADIFFRQIRLFLILAYVVSAIFVLWFLLIYIGVLPFDIASIYAAIILSGIFLDGSSPLVYELICEAAYPVSEGVSSCFLQMLFVIVGMAFAAVQNIPNIGTVWMNWCLLGTLCAAIPLLFCVTDTYTRADLDDLDNQVNPPENPSTQQDLKEPLMNGRLPSPALSPSSSPFAVPSRSSPSFHTRTQRGYGARSCPPELSCIPAWPQQPAAAFTQTADCRETADYRETAELKETVNLWNELQSRQ